MRVNYQVKNGTEKTLNFGRESKVGTYRGGCYAIPRRKEPGCVFMLINQGLKTAKCRGCKLAQASVVSKWTEQKLVREICRRDRTIGGKVFRIKWAGVVASKDSVSIRPEFLALPPGWKSCARCQPGYEMSQFGCAKFVPPVCPRGYRFTITKKRCFKLAP